MKKFPRSIVRGMEDDTNEREQSFGPLNEVYAEYYKEGSARAGVLNIIAAGRYFVNGIALPKNEAEFREKYPQGLFLNGEPWLRQGLDGWDTGAHGPFRRPAPDFESALCDMLLNKQPNGVEVLLLDEDGDGYADRIETTQYLAAQIQSVVKNEDGTVSVDRGDFDRSIPCPERFARFLRMDRCMLPEQRIDASRFDASIRPGDVMVYWQTAAGWQYRRAAEVKGVFNEGMDHEGYTVGGIHYPDAMGYPRNMLASNRPGGFSNIMNYFGFAGDPSAEISLWLIPVSEYATAFGAPFGFGSNENAAVFLDTAIALAEAKLAETVPGENGKASPAGKKWIVPALYEELQGAVAMAKEARAKETRGTFLDFMTYLIFVTLAGTRDDISASFMGYDFKGFDKFAFDHFTLAETDSSLTGSAYDACFGCGSAAEGLKEIVKAGEVYINNYRIAPAEVVSVNGAEVICKTADGYSWAAGEKTGIAGSFEDALCAYLTALSTMPGQSLRLDAPTGAVTSDRVTVFVNLTAVLGRTGGNFKFLQLFDEAGNIFTDAAGRPIEVRKLYADGYDMHEHDLHDKVLYRLDADFRGGEWALYRA